MPPQTAIRGVVGDGQVRSAEIRHTGERGTRCGQDVERIGVATDTVSPDAVNLKDLDEQS